MRKYLIKISSYYRFNALSVSLFKQFEEFIKLLVLLAYVYLKCCLFKMFIKVFSVKRDYLVIKRIIFCNFLNLVYLLISMLSYYLNWILRFHLYIKKWLKKIYCFQIVSLDCKNYFSIAEGNFIENLF